jgi:hypothetical protein
MTCVTRCHGAGVAEFLLDTEIASRLMRAERTTLTGLRRSGAKSVSISSISMAELLYGARLRDDNPSVMASVRAFLTRIRFMRGMRRPLKPTPGFVLRRSGLGAVREHLTS